MLDVDIPRDEIVDPPALIAGPDFPWYDRVALPDADAVGRRGRGGLHDGRPAVAAPRARRRDPQRRRRERRSRLRPGRSTGGSSGVPARLGAAPARVADARSEWRPRTCSPGPRRRATSPSSSSSTSSARTAPRTSAGVARRAMGRRSGDAPAAARGRSGWPARSGPMRPSILGGAAARRVRRRKA